MPSKPPEHPIYTFHFFSRCGKQRTAILLDEKRGIFSVSGESAFFRGGEDMIDFEGGPFYMVGGDFHELGEISSVRWAPQPDESVGAHLPTVLVSVTINRKGRRKITKWRKDYREAIKVGDQADERSGGQGAVGGAPRCCSGLCRRGECPTGGEVAVRDRQEERVGDCVQPDPVEGRNGDGVAGSVEGQVRRLQEDIARSHEQRRRELEVRYPRVFGEQPLGTPAWEFGYGWDSLIRSLSAAIDGEIERHPELTQGDIPFSIVQMKEKFGTLRIYHDGGNKPIQGMIAMTESLSSSICEVCGEIGSLKRSGEGKGGWYKTMCDDCAAKMGYAKDEGDEDK